MTVTVIGAMVCGVVVCGVVVCGCVPKALLPEGNGRDVYPWVQVNGRAVCIACALCVSVWISAERDDMGDLEGTHQATAISPEAPAELALSLSAC